MQEEEKNEGRVRLITTDDGSHSLFVPSLNETYHSFHGAVQESRHVFIKMGLDFMAAGNSEAPVYVFEVGLGTGLNALLAAEYAHSHQTDIHFTSIEAFPVGYELAKSLNYPGFLNHPDASLWFQKIHLCQWHHDEQVHPHFTINKLESRLEEHQLPQHRYNVIFFDAFAPNKQAELWDINILERIAHSMARGAVFVTYCAKGQLKRDLRTAGLEVETLPGPPGKKEMVRAVKI